MRLFAAVLPPRPALDHLEQALTSVRGPAGPDGSRSRLRWTLPDDRHLTLAFYAEVPQGRVEDVADALSSAAAAVAPFDLMLRGAGAFDHRILWVGCGGQTADLSRLAAACGDVGAQVLGRSDDRVRSRTHLTVARVGPGDRRRPPRHRAGHRGAAADPAAAAAGVAELAHALAVYQGPRWTVQDVALVASALGAGPSGRPRREVLHRFALLPVAG